MDCFHRQGANKDRLPDLVMGLTAIRHILQHKTSHKLHNLVDKIIHMANCALRLFQLLFNCFCSTGRWVGRAATFQQPIRHQVGHSKFLPTKQTRNDQTLLALDARKKISKDPMIQPIPNKKQLHRHMRGLDQATEAT